MAGIGTSESLTGLEIAVVGMAGRFPGADNIDQFWRNLQDGVESITSFSDEELLAAGADPDEIKDPLYVRAGATLKNAEQFDAAFFGMYPREAEIMDPQQRVLLECAWEALEHAGYDPQGYGGAVGVFAGQSMPTYLVSNLLRNREIGESVHPYQLVLGNDKDFLATRVSYKLNLRGPSVVVQTACSTSLVAVHMACQSLLGFGCDMALAGGVSIRVPQQKGYRYQEGGIASPDGRCRAFDADANGTVGGNGAGLVVLKRLEDALADGDTIHAVIKGSAINNDGAVKIGYTAPSIEGQAEVIASAQMVASVEPGTIGYIEAHGTGTALGDPIEIAALSQAFGAGTWTRRSCAIGSVKTNIGHLDAAAGVVGLIKTVLALKHRMLPPSLHFERPNPKIDFDNSPFYVNHALSPWPANGYPRRAAVSSFGIGGTNAHSVLEEAPVPAPSSGGRSQQLLVLSARSAAALDTASANLARYLRETPDANLADVAYTLQVGRRAFAHRRTLSCRTAAEAVATLEGSPGARVHNAVHAGAQRPVTMMFTGQGAQYVNMGLGLYRTEPAFRTVVDRCAEMLRPHLGLDLREVLYPTSDYTDEAAALLDETRITQPALFVVEYALAQLWTEWGVRPESMIGHSIGEYVAACLAGVFSLKDALMLVAARGQLMQEQPRGSMLSVFLPVEAASELLDERLALAASNAPSMCVLAGPTEAIEGLERRLEERSVEFRRLRTSHAFHSPMMEPALVPFADLVAGVELAPPSIPFVSNVTGTWITDTQATDPEYWARHLRNAVRFADGIGAIAAEPDRLLLEIGPGNTLASLAQLHPDIGMERTVVTSLRHPREAHPDEAVLLDRLGRVWAAGAHVDWGSFHQHARRRRVPLPSYPFERQRFWIEPDAGYEPSGNRNRAGKLRRNPRVADWFYLPSWKRADLAAPGAGVEPGRWLVFNDGELGSALIERLRYAGHEVVEVRSGSAFAREGDDRFVLRASERADYDALLRAVRGADSVPTRILHLWSLAAPSAAHTNGNAPVTPQERGYYSVVQLAAALGRHNVAGAVQLAVVTGGVHEVSGDETLHPEQATVLGPCRVIAQEYPHIVCRSIDVVLPEPDDARRGRLVDALIGEFAADAAERTVAYRGRHRWVQIFEPLRTEAEPADLPARPGGTYLITGGMGRLGLLWAEFLARRGVGTLALLGRSALPPRAEWDGWLATHEDRDRSATAIRRVRELEALGARVLPLAADVADRDQLATALAEVRTHAGAIHGVIHAAGTVGEDALTPIQDAGRSDADLHFRAKVHGLLALEEALREDAPDWVILQGSLSSTLGGLGFAAYAGANAFMDAFALRQNQPGTSRWLSVGWDGWQFGDVEAHHAMGAQAAELSIRPEESDEAFQRVLGGSAAGQLVVSTADLQARLDRWVTHDVAAEAIADAVATSTSRHPRPALATPFVEPHTELERSIAAMWQNVLGIEPIGANDDFFELGGHSLLATQLVSRLRDRFQAELPLKKLFESPTVAGLAALIEEVRGVAEPAGPVLRPIPRDGELPLSSAQQRLLFLDELVPDSALYNNAAAVRLSGRLDVEVLKRCLAVLVERHEVLRTSFVSINGQRVQTIHPALEVPLPVIDLAGQPEAAQDEEVQRLTLEEARRPFDLAQAPLLRVTLLRLSDEEHVAILVMHHIISDGWSVGVLVQELGALYAAFRAEQPSPLAPLPVQYVDFAAWQREWLAGERLERQIGYWKEQLAGAPPLLELPVDHPRTVLADPPGATHRFRISREIAERAREVTQQEGATLFMTLMAVWQSLLARYSGQTDISVGTPIAGRTRAEVEGLIGFFINTLVLRTDLSGEPHFRELIGRVREAALGAFQHQDLPFEMLVEALQPERNLGQSPLFQVMFALQNAPMRASRFDDLTLSPVDVDTGTAKFDLTLLVEEEGDELAGALVYNTELFECSTIERMAEHFALLLEQLLSAPDRPVAAAPLLTATEQQLLSQWSVGDLDLAADRCIHELISEQAARTPDAIALEAAGERLTYAELEQRSNRLAHLLRAHGVGRESRVGVHLERSPDVVVSLLATLKAGGAYLPLDPSYPADRLAFMIEDAAPVVVLTDEKRRQETGGAEGAGGAREGGLGAVPAANSFAGQEGPGAGNSKFPPFLSLDRLTDEIAAQPITAPESDVRRDDAAYVIYTSGSTGQPKGVVVEHGVLAGHCREVAAHFGLTAEDRVLQFAALAFDPSLEQILPSLMSGATTVLRGEEGWTADGFQARVREHHLTVVNVPPAFWQQWMQALSSPTPQIALESALRLVIVGGDVMPAEGLRLWQASPLRGARLLNAYGPTETAITAATFDVPAGFEPALGRLPIGRPLGARRFHVLDEQGNLTPVGVPGELYIGGDRLARGYLNREDLTAERFVADPFSADPGARLYRTGDRVRWLANGVLEFVGRTDEQIKLRGFRIEPGEIEAALMRHPAVAAAAVALQHRNGTAGDRWLVAYVVGKETGEKGVEAISHSIGAAELRAHLRQNLPEYMVPAAFVTLTSLPLTPSGKIDRAALPAPSADAAQERAAYAAPSTPVEEQLAAVWSGVLGVERVGIYDNFFELGGHSLLATQMVARVRDHFGIELPLRRLFETPTIAELSILIAQSLAEHQNHDDLAAMLAELEAMSEDEVQALLSDQSGEST